MVKVFKFQRAICQKLPISTYPHLHLAPPMWVTPFEFCRHLRHQKTRVPALLCGTVCMILRLAVSKHQLVMDIHRASMAVHSKNRQVIAKIRNYSDVQILIN